MTESTIPATADVALAYARCFGTDDGARVLEHLRAQTLDRALGPDAPDATLRHLEGQRQLVVTILARIARGRAGPGPPPADRPAS